MLTSLRSNHQEISIRTRMKWILQSCYIRGGAYNEAWNWMLPTYFCELRKPWKIKPWKPGMIISGIPEQRTRPWNFHNKKKRNRVFYYTCDILLLWNNFRLNQSCWMLKAWPRHKEGSECNILIAFISMTELPTVSWLYGKNSFFDQNRW